MKPFTYSLLLLSTLCIQERASAQTSSSKNTLEQHATITVSGSKNVKKNPPSLLTTVSKKNIRSTCWISDKQNPVWVTFTWEEPQRIGRVTLQSGFQHRPKTTFKEAITRFEIQAKTTTGWKTIPGGIAPNNTDFERTIDLYPVACTSMRIFIPNETADEIYLRQVTIEPWDMSKRPPPPISIGAKKFAEVELRNAYIYIRSHYGFRASGKTPIPYEQLREEADGNRTVYLLSGKVRTLNGAKEILVGKRGWVIMRNASHGYKVGDQVVFMAQKSLRKTSSNRASGENDASLKRRYNDLTIHYKDFIYLLQRGHRFPELNYLFE